MFDSTPVLKVLIALAITITTTFIIPCIQEKRKSDKLSKIFSIVEQVVYAAWELDITGDLVKMGVTKAEYAWQQAKNILAKKNLSINDEELEAYIKGEVARLRINRGDSIVNLEE